MHHTDCKLCGEKSYLIKSDCPGYQLPDTYSIFECPGCDTQFSLPMAVNKGLYNLIYDNITEVPGYRRYFQYAENVKKEQNPLQYLADSEAMYWFIHEYMTKNVSKNSKVLEMGCGAGYTTYALNQAGFSVQGMDISQSAVDRARGSYGDHYMCADVKTFAQNSNDKFDVIYLTEVIEHLPDFMEILRAAKSLLEDQGVILVTTPNKSYYPPAAIWQTESPPIHLWWFSETSLRFVAKKLSMRSQFWDFSDDNLKGHSHLIERWQKLRKPFFDENNHLLVRAKSNKNNRHKSWCKRISARILRSTLNKYPFRSKTLAVVLHQSS